MPTAHPAAEIITRAAQLARAFREQDVPVVLVNVTGAAPGRTDAVRPNFARPANWSELVPELEQHPDDYLVTKQRPGAFIGTSLHDYLQQRGATQIFLAGISTSIGVEATARSAYDYGYNVVFVADAITDRSADAHRYCIENVFPRLGEIDTTENVLKFLQKPPAP